MKNSTDYSTHWYLINKSIISSTMPHIFLRFLQLMSFFWIEKTAFFQRYMRKVIINCVNLCWQACFAIFKIEWTASAPAIELWCWRAIFQVAIFDSFAYVCIFRNRWERSFVIYENLLADHTAHLLKKFQVNLF